jgi:hypothetical protein
MSVNANYAATPKVGVGQVSTANTALDGTGTIVTIFTAGASGSRLDSVTVKATATVANGIVRLFVHNGTTAFLLCEIIVLASTSSTTVTSFEDGRKLDMVLPSGWSLRASTTIAQPLNVIAVGGDF